MSYNISLIIKRINTINPLGMTPNNSEFSIVFMDLNYLNNNNNN